MDSGTGAPAQPGSQGVCACVASGAFSQLGCVVGRKQAAAPPQPPPPPRGVGAIQHLDDVSGGEAQLVVLLSGEVVQRPHLQRVRPLQDREGSTVRHRQGWVHLWTGAWGRSLLAGLNYSFFLLYIYCHCLYALCICAVCLCVCIYVNIYFMFYLCNIHLFIFLVKQN